MRAANANIVVRARAPGFSPTSSPPASRRSLIIYARTGVARGMPGRKDVRGGITHYARYRVLMIMKHIRRALSI